MTRVARIALWIGAVSLVVNLGMLAVSLWLWKWAEDTGQINEVVFVSRVSMLALVFAAVSGLAAALAGIFAALPTEAPD
jgi:hypothetical protein